ncbi:MAG: hypothetical protein OXB92_16805 [Acidimicrobiaceae bacterium]|nr:hypothetical protein [Acidimicrobiaceae bacterium]
MTVTYIGKSGLLNQNLCELLAKDLAVMVSARKYSQQEAFQSDTLVWGGRYLIGDILEKIEGNSDVNFLYISTFIYNDFCDNYQIRKLSDSMRVEQAGAQSLNIPFVYEFQEQMLKKIATKESSDYFTYFTQLNDILNAILAFDEQGVLSLNKIRVNIKLSKRERLLWKLFSLLYVKKGNAHSSKITFAYLNAVKALEKILHKLIFCHGLSAVYIARDG